MKLMRTKELNWLSLFKSVKGILFMLGLAAGFVAAPVQAQTLREALRATGFKIAYESYDNGNSDILVMNADGSNPVNLTQTPTQQEHYPQVCPDGTKICFVTDEGEGRDTVRNVDVMDIDGHNRKRVADHAREPFWSPDGKVIGFLPQEFEKFDVIDFSTKGMSFYDLATGKITPHVNTTNLHHLYHPKWSPDGKWIVATVHAGMGYDHTILLIEAHGDKIINLKIPGCRPCFSADGTHVAWGADDHVLAAAPINLEAAEPAVSPWTVHIKDETNKLYHVSWSPDDQFLAFSRGPDEEGDLSKRGTFQGPAEVHGVYAARWNICVARTSSAADLHLEQATDADFVMLTTNGLSNKEPVWFRPHDNKQTN